MRDRYPPDAGHADHELTSNERRARRTRWPRRIANKRFAPRARSRNSVQDPAAEPTVIEHRATAARDPGNRDMLVTLARNGGLSRLCARTRSAGSVLARASSAMPGPESTKHLRARHPASRRELAGVRHRNEHRGAERLMGEFILSPAGSGAQITHRRARYRASRSEPNRQFCAGAVTYGVGSPSCSAAGAGDECGHDVGGVPIEGAPGPVVAHGGSWVCMRRSFLDIAQGDAGIQGGGDERVPQRMR